MITAHDEPTIREQCLADGASAYLRKPLRGDLLFRSIQAAINGARHDRTKVHAGDAAIDDTVRFITRAYR